MSNPIKYSTGSESLALKKGNFYIGTGDVGKGPTSSTGYYNGITPPTGGYTIYLNKASGGPSIYTCANDTELVNLTNTIAGTSYTTANECLVYFAGQTDKIVLNRNYEGIVTNGLIYDFDAGFVSSYPKNGSNLYDISVSNSDGQLYNGVTFSTSGGGSLVFDGTDDSAYSNSNLSSLPYGDSSRTIMYWIYPYTISNSVLSQIAGYGLDTGSGNLFCGIIYSNGKAGLWGNSINYQSTHTVNTNVWQHIAYVKTPGTIKCYKNGIGDNGGSLTLNTVSSSRPFMGIVYQRQIYGYYNGEISIFQIYNRALSDTEVLQNYNAQKGRFGL